MKIKDAWSSIIWTRQKQYLQINKQHNFCREHAGGTKFAKKSSKYYSDVNALRGPTAEAPAGITTPSVP